MNYLLKPAVFTLLTFCLINLINCQDKEKIFKKDVILQFKSNATFDCSPYKEPSFFIRKVNDTEYTEIKHDEKKIRIEGNILTIIDLRGDAISAEYYCTSNVTTRIRVEFNKKIAPYIYYPEKQSQTVSAGNKVEFKCKLFYGNENNEKVTWKWLKFESSEKKGENRTQVALNETRVTITSTNNETTLTIPATLDSDRGEYQCQLENTHGSQAQEFNLRVKDALAALWPFLAICAEVVILCTILLVYEKKCSKKRNPAEEDNEQTHNLMGRDGSDLKKRTVKT